MEPSQDLLAAVAERKRRQQRIGRTVAIAAITALMLSVPWVTWTAYDNLKGSVEALEAVSRPDGDRLVVEEMRGHLARAGNSVIRYVLTRTPDDLDQYRSARKNLDGTLASFDPNKLLPEDKESLDTLQKLIIARYDVLDDWVKLADRSPAKSFNQVQQVINEAQNLPADSLAAAQNRRKNRRNLEQEIEAISSVAEQQAGYFAVIEDRLDAARRKELLQEEARRKLALNLAAEDATLNRNITFWLDRLDRHAISRAESLAAASRVKSEQVNQMIFLYGILATAILLLLVTGLIYLFRRGDRMEAVMERTLAQERGLVRAREAFLANMSHELRTPLHAISGFADRLTHSSLPPREKEYAETIADASSHLLGLVEHVLDYARVSASEDAIGTEPVRIETLLDEVVAFIQPRAEAKSLWLEKSVSEQVPEWLLGDQLRLRQALLNLAANAVKFTEIGHVRIRAGGQPMPDGRFRLLLEVEDSGPGIREADRERIFEPFQQGDDSGPMYREGLGLGLAITADLVRRMGGTMELDSSLGQGSHFRLVLPLEVASESVASSAGPSAGISAGNNADGRAANGLANEAANKAVKGAANGAVRNTSDSLRLQTMQRMGKRRILAADDEAFNRKLLDNMLSGFDAEIVADGLAAVEAFEREPADLLLFDVRMPGLDGHGALKAIRETAPGIPAAAITAGVTEAEQRACQASGFNALLPKPFSEKDLMQLLIFLLDGRSAESEAALDPASESKAAEMAENQAAVDTQAVKNGKVAKVPQRAVAPKVVKIPQPAMASEADVSEPGGPSTNFSPDPGQLQLDSLHALAGEDDNFVPDMLQLFLERLEETRKDWEAALAAQDGMAVGAAAHKLAAPARQLGFEELAAALKALEAEADGGASIEALANRCRRLQPMLHTTALRVGAELEKAKLP